MGVFEWTISIVGALQLLQYETNLDSYEHNDNIKLTIFLDIISSLGLPISLIREQPQAYEEEIIAFEISHPPPYLLPNKFLVINSLDDT